MDKMLQRHNYDMSSRPVNLWMNREHIRQLYDDGNIIGLHSLTHPTTISSLPDSDQEREYVENRNDIAQITDEDVIAVSYPCGRYNDYTLKLMAEMGIKIGFRSNMAACERRCHALEYGREDHANIMRQIRA